MSTLAQKVPKPELVVVTYSSRRLSSLAETFRARLLLYNDKRPKPKPEAFIYIQCVIGNIAYVLSYCEPYDDRASIRVEPEFVTVRFGFGNRQAARNFSLVREEVLAE